MMDINDLVNLSRNNRALLWDAFRYEQILEDTEDDLLKDLEYYHKKLKLLDEANSPLDMGVVSVYKAHINSLNRLLGVIDNIKTTHQEDNKQMNIFQQ
ncbi:MAG: hypothetical protein MI673_04915 [Thiotrichales bacterium]|nr:hypothetical protein [Thiotrichales bacterium]